VRTDDGWRRRRQWTGISDSPFYPFTMTLSQFRDQVTGTVQARASSISLPVSGIVRVTDLVLEATAKPSNANCVFQLGEHHNAGMTTMSVRSPRSSLSTGFGILRSERARIFGLSHAVTVECPRSRSRTLASSQTSPNECDFRPKFWHAP
jgi:hypothetical protein